MQPGLTGTTPKHKPHSTATLPNYSYHVEIKKLRDRESIQAGENPTSFYFERFAKVLGEPNPVAAAQK
ncbi:hypothetical protein BV372_09225 [Nostoc sp. T09]|uniref:hypothetical protein n=1 Tax=Nostoc sp. T09 TaxID=1932621 RepID=UPI000A372944|nr:hypothetical protein [Nostoc sp. T09]OUL35895.1 hypothetical protein BV372_09225 [Nostoc sp. T09]